MPLGAQDHIDQMLVKRYAKEQTNNPEDAQTLNITRDRYWEIMKDVAQVHMTMVKVATVAKNAVQGKEMKPSENRT